MNRIFVCIALCIASAGVARGQDGGEKPLVDTFEIECRDGESMTAEMWTVPVSENRTKDDAKTISLAVLRVKSPRRRPSEPVFFIAGGPGGSSIDAVKGMVASGGKRFFDLIGGDIVAIDQRGVGLSKPNLSTNVLYGVSPKNPGDPNADLQNQLDVIEAEASRFREQGVDLNGYNTRESADDINEVRKALGYDQIVLWGSSYGTHLAMATIRQHESIVARALLVGPEGPDHTQKLPSDAQRVLAHISMLWSQEPEQANQPTMLEQLDQVLKKVDESPVYVELEGDQVRIGRSDVQGYVAMKIISIRNGADLLPAEIEAMSQGDFSEIAKAVYEYRKTDGPQSMMALAMDAASGASSKRKRRIRTEAKTCVLGSSMNADLEKIAEAISIEPLDASFRSTLHAKTPVLFVVGSLDCRTPVGNAEFLMETMPNAKLVVVENCGHTDLPLGMPELRDMWGGFLRNGNGRSATLAGPPIQFKKPDSGESSSEMEVTVDQMKPLEGRYRFSHGAVMSIKVGEDCLVVTIPRKGDFNFWPRSPLEFEPEIDQLPVLTFQKNAAGKVVSVTGNGKVAKRVGR